ncbi:unnamed protein product [Diabrotica balteata]|uniref:Uncharacterized protein n=1 Tax=Diabrotica balteata TaxID=107213 RepID=A0A9N9XGG3_DIABA|nr:unnamed protein product [Diabrotica balteata]
MSELVPEPSGCSTAKTVKQRKSSAPFSIEELEEILCDSDYDDDDPTFSLREEARKSGWSDSDDEEESDEGQAEEEEMDSTVSTADTTQTSKDDVPLNSVEVKTLR